MKYLDKISIGILGIVFNISKIFFNSLFSFEYVSYK